jgi:hypothetical protein
MSPLPDTEENVVTRWFGAGFAQLDPLLQRLHRRGGSLAGDIEIRIGNGIAGSFGRQLARALNLPIDRRVRGFEVRIGHTESSLIWARRFDNGAEMVSVFEPVGAWPEGHWLERTGPLTLRLTVDIDDGGWRWLPLGVSWRGIALPRGLMPSSDAYKRVESGRYLFHVAFSLPGIGPVLSYGGTLDAR